MVEQCTAVNILATGSLYIISFPPGASILIDDILQIGKTTPDTITGITEGFHDVTIRMTVVPAYTTTVFVEAGTIIYIPSPSLIPNEGCIYFNTNPPGASIYIDDILRTETTPSLICELGLGPHTYRLYREGYLDVTGNIDLTLGQGEIISQEMIPIVEAGFGGGGMFLVAGLAIGAMMLMSKKK